MKVLFVMRIIGFVDGGAHRTRISVLVVAFAAIALISEFPIEIAAKCCKLI